MGYMRIRYFVGLVLVIGIILIFCKLKVSLQDVLKDVLLVLIDKIISSVLNEVWQGIFIENMVKVISSIF